jgi:glycerophosphoryl diester phosphodiesterase
VATLRLAHRGDWRVAPENSLAALEAATRVPACDGLEFDIRASRDGAAVLLHDDTLARVQGVPAACATLSVAELAEHGVPTLAQVLAAVGCDPFLDVELKEVVPGAIDALELERGRIDDDGRPALRDAVLSSFHPEILEWLGAERPTWPRWANTMDLDAETISRAVDLGCSALSVQWQAIDEAGMARAAAAGLAVAAWTVRDLGDYERLAALGLIGICVEAAALDG